MNNYDYKRMDSAQALGFNTLKTLDDEQKLKILTELYNRFDTSWELEAHLNKTTNCCGKKG